MLKEQPKNTQQKESEKQKQKKNLSNALRQNLLRRKSSEQVSIDNDLK